MSSPSTLTLSALTDAVAGGAVAIRAITKLLPAGGATDKVFPPTYVKDKQSLTSTRWKRGESRDVTSRQFCSIRSLRRRIESKRPCLNDGGVANSSFQ